MDVDTNPEAVTQLEALQNGGRTIPTVVFSDGSFAVNPGPQELAEKLGLTIRAANDYYDVIIIGGGPAGLTTAIYTAREDTPTLVIDRGGLGGQAAVTEMLDNVPGFHEGISGRDLAERLGLQVKRFGAETLVAQETTGITVINEYKLVRTAMGDEYCSKAVVLSPGSTYRRLGVPGEDKFIGAGIHFCATCDGPFYKGQDVLVIGGGNSGVQQAVYLTKFADKVTLIERGDRLLASSVLIDRAESDPKIEIFTNTTVQEFKGEHRVRSVVLEDLAHNTTREISPSGVFLFIGLVPNTAFLEGVVDLDKWGYILTGRDLPLREPMAGMLETSVPGIFAAGDARLGSTKQVAAATGEGATAALMVRQYLEHR